jgi:hypothetical protein
MTQPIYIEKLATFSCRDGKFDVAIFSGEFLKLIIRRFRAAANKAVMS